MDPELFPEDLRGSATWLRSLRRPLAWGLAAALLTALVSLFLPNQYRSEARILPADPRSGGSLAQMAAAAAAVGVAVPGQESADAAYVDILTSRWMAEQLLQSPFRFHLRRVHLGPLAFSFWRLGSEEGREQTLYAYLDKPNLDRAVSALKRLTTVSRDLKTKLLTVQVETPSPELSQQVVRRMVSLLEEFVVTKSQTKCSAKAAFSAKRLVEARVEMAQAEEDLRRFLDTNRNYLQSADPAIRLRGLRLENELKLRTQLLTTLAISREQALMEEKNDMPILNVLDPGNIPIDKSWPARRTMVLLAGLLATLASLAYQNRRWIRDRLVEAPGQD